MVTDFVCGGLPRIRFWLPRRNGRSDLLVGQNACRLLAYAIDRIEDRSVVRKRIAGANGEGVANFMRPITRSPSFYHAVR